MGLEGCPETLGGWTLGMTGQCFNPQAGFRIGKNAPKVAALQVLLILIIMKNGNRRSSHGHRGSKRRELAVTRTLTWIARILSHTYINTVITTLCEAPAQLLHNLESIL